MIAKPLPCTCGHRPIVHYEIIGQVWHFVDCVCGHDCGPSASTEPEAIAGWNACRAAMLEPDDAGG